ncbi:MAG: sugar kinase [Planctomycetia bacterium]|nr:sugar kinase [Planctomycetia bacterium]
MSLLVVGSVAFDSVETPTAKRDNVVGGSATFFSYAAGYFTPVSLVAEVGEDWPEEHTKLLRSQQVNTDGLRVVPGAKTFRWRGKYMPNMNDRETLEVQLNVFETFNPKLSDAEKKSKFVFLANGSPIMQLNTLEQVEKPALSVCDTMDLWINIQREPLLKLLKRIDGIVLNDSEAKLLTGHENLVRAGQEVRKLGPKFVIVKKGEHGAMFCGENETYVLPAFPTSNVVDPTGAGDSFAGGMMGYLAAKGNFEPRTLKEALAYGTIVASYNVEDFSLDRMKQIKRADLDQRMTEYKQMLAF